MIPFPDRIHAGEALAERLAQEGDWTDATVLALPRGVPVAFWWRNAWPRSWTFWWYASSARPAIAELAMGAIASGGVRVMNEDIVRYVHASGAEIDGTIAQESHELQRREQAYRGDRPRPVVAGRAVIWWMTDWPRAPPCAPR